jgi:ketosteroid isomerase-like protein
MIRSPRFLCTANSGTAARFRSKARSGERSRRERASSVRVTSRAIGLIAIVGLLGCASGAKRTAVTADFPTLIEAKRGIEEGYRRNRAAFLAKDVKAVMALRTGDFCTIGPDGTRRDRAAMETYTIGFLNGIERWIEIEFAIDSLAPDGREADAITRQHLTRMAIRPDSKVHHVETWVTQRERWRWTADGWKLARVDQVRDQKRLVDGKPD